MDYCILVSLLICPTSSSSLGSNARTYLTALVCLAEAGHVAVPAYESEPLLQPEYQIPQGVEANASSGAIALRKGLDPALPADRRRLAELSDDDPVWDVTAHYLAGLCMNLILISSPEKIGPFLTLYSMLASLTKFAVCVSCDARALLLLMLSLSLLLIWTQYLAAE